MVVNIEKVENSYEELLLQRRKLLEKQDEIEQIRKTLGDLPEYDEIISQVVKIEQKIKDECRGILMLARALYEIIDRYKRTESDIVGIYEGRTEREAFRVADILNIELPIFQVLKITL